MTRSRWLPWCLLMLLSACAAQLPGRPSPADRPHVPAASDGRAGADTPGAEPAAGASGEPSADRPAAGPAAALPGARPQRDAALLHQVALLQRLSFGVNGVLLAQVGAAGGEERWLDAQLHPGSADPLPAEVSARLGEFLSHQQALEPLVIGIERRRKVVRVLAGGPERKESMDALRETAVRLGREAQLELLWRETYSQNQVQELLTSFWCNYFSVFIGKGDVQLLAADYVNRAIRPHVLGRFQDLLRAAARHPAMLRYLDNDRNAVGRINENFARELLELHTLGVDGGYGQKDVQELARALTGFGVWTGTDPGRPRAGSDNWRREGLLEYAPGRHDFGEKTLLGERIKARGWAEFDEVLGRLARHPATIHRVSERLATFLLGRAPSPELLAQMHERWAASDGDLRQLVLTVIHSADFERSLNTGFKSPQRFVMAAIRLAYEDRPVLNLQPALNWLNRMQHAPFGYPTPDGYPLRSDAWTASGQFATRFEIARQLGFGSAGLFRPEGARSEEQPAFPQLATPFFYRAIEPGLDERTRAALAQARTPQEWTMLLLASPEMMRY